jgi:hypothetical protein
LPVAPCNDTETVNYKPHSRLGTLPLHCDTPLRYRVDCLGSCSRPSVVMLSPPLPGLTDYPIGSPSRKFRNIISISACMQALILRILQLGVFHPKLRFVLGIEAMNMLAPTGIVGEHYHPLLCSATYGCPA